MSTFNIVSRDNESTVVAEYTPVPRRDDSYQSEADLEREFIEILKGQGYEYISVNDESGLITNLRRQLEMLNGITFSDAEWKQFFDRCLANPNESIAMKTSKIQDDYRQELVRDDGSKKNVVLIDKRSIHNNRLQVLNQYETADGKHANRYDVTVLVNGLPLIHIELKRRGVAIREAFNQIRRYQRESFWAASGLFKYVQIFVISNGTHTKYYSNTTRQQHTSETKGTKSSTAKTSNSFEFTSYWADAANHAIPDLVDFARTFFARHTILNIITHYCVFTSDKLLLVMRPYQIVATERILLRIDTANNYNRYGSVDGGGYIWHTTGSGKTLTSFKTAQLASFLPFIDKVLFVVDRKDLDYQTMKEYERFGEGAVIGNTSTKMLAEQLDSLDAPIIVTTIQKLGLFVKRHKNHDVYGKRVVLIFDECHRSQFGDMRQAITKAFKKHLIFGFTGTPIFPVNSGSGRDPSLRTTEQSFGDKLHTYTIVDAINDGNVLPFRIDYINTIKMPPEITDKSVYAIDTDRAMNAPQRISMVVKYILEHFYQKTMRQSSYSHRIVTNTGKVAGDKTRHTSEVKETRRVWGFNSIFAVSNSVIIQDSGNRRRVVPIQLYYDEFRRQIAEGGRDLKIAAIFSYSANEAESDDEFDNGKLDDMSRDFLERAIADYNAMFETSFDTSSDKFQNYYKDVSFRLKNREIDMLIVVNMFLTGFDATTLNTLWVDRNLQHHGLIQAFSRTNRILNSVKTFGNIVCFRDLKQATDDAIALFGDKDAGGVIVLKTYNDYVEGYVQDGKTYPGYKALVKQLEDDFPLGVPIEGEHAQKNFIQLFGNILRLRNVLLSFDDFVENSFISERDFQDYQSKYIDLYQDSRTKDDVEKEDINDDIVFEIELIKQIEVNIDYILMLVAKYHKSNCADKEILVTVEKAVNSSLELRSKKELIEGFVARVSTDSNIDEDWRRFVDEQKESELAELIRLENLQPDKTTQFVSNMFRDGFLKTSGIELDEILPPMSRFDSGRDAKKKGVIAKLRSFLEKYKGI